MANYRVISSDNHVFEPPDLWTSRAKPAFKDRVPQLVREYDGDWWYCDGHRVIGLSPGAQTGMRFEEPEKMVRTTTFDKVRRGGYDPAEHLKDMDADDVDVSIVYPTVGLLLYSVPDSALLSEIFRGYNDWLAEFCAGEPKRLKGIAMINVDDVQEGIKELQQAVNLRPGYDDAMSYLSLLYRRKADLDCGDEAAHKADMAMFDQWRDKTMATRKANEEKKNQQTPGGITMDGKQ